MSYRDTIGFPKEDAVAIEKTCPELERIVSTDQELEVLGSGFGAAEGPLWHREATVLKVKRNERRLSESGRARASHA